MGLHHPWQQLICRVSKNYSGNFNPSNYHFLYSGKSVPAFPLWYKQLPKALASCTHPGHPIQTSVKQYRWSCVPCKMIECQSLQLEVVSWYSLGEMMGMWVPSTAPSHCGTPHLCVKPCKMFLRESSVGISI